MVILNKFRISETSEINNLISKIQNLLNSHKSIQQVFFYGPAVLQAHVSKSPQEILGRWQELSKSIPLIICPNSAIKRAVYDIGLSQEYDGQVTLDKSFKIGSLTEFFSLLAGQYPSQEIIIIFKNNLTKPSVELEEALDFTLMAASLDWQVKIIFQESGVNLFNQNKKYFTELFDMYDIEQSSVVVLDNTDQINNIKLDNKLIVSF